MPCSGSRICGEKRLPRAADCGERDLAGKSGDYGVGVGSLADRLVTAIRASDHATLTRIPGIGKKTAERVVVELKDKLDDLAVAPVAAADRAGTLGLRGMMRCQRW